MTTNDERKYDAREECSTVRCTCCEDLCLEGHVDGQGECEDCSSADTRCPEERAQDAAALEQEANPTITKEELLTEYARKAALRRHHAGRLCTAALCWEWVDPYADDTDYCNHHQGGAGLWPGPSLCAASGGRRFETDRGSPYRTPNGVPRSGGVLPFHHHHQSTRWTTEPRKGHRRAYA